MIDLTDLPHQVATPHLITNGSELTPYLGGVGQQLNRLGTRFMIEYTIPPMRIEADGRRWISRLMRAKREGVSVRVPQVEFDVGTPGATLIDGAVAGGTSLPVTGGTARYPIKEGQWLSVRRGGSGRSYLYNVTGQTILDGSGEGVVSIFPMLRAALVDGDVINLGRPVIEGSIDGDDVSWTLDAVRTVGLTFTVRERA
jgi:hypothetical protein